MRLSEYAHWLEKHPCLEVGGPQYCLNLYTLAESVQAKIVLEIGTGWGCSTTAFAASLSQRPGSYIVTLDQSDRMEPKCRRLLEKIGVPVHSVRSTLQDYACPEPLVDIVYVDLDGSRESVDMTYESFHRLLPIGGLFVIDGVFGQVGPTGFVRDSGLPFTCLQYATDYAHGVYRRPGSMALPHFTHCRDCSWSTSEWSPDAVVKQANKHALSSGHSVAMGGQTIRSVV